MSLICVHCGHITVMSENPDHYHFCHKCNLDEITESEKKQIEDSNRGFGKK